MTAPSARRTAATVLALALALALPGCGAVGGDDQGGNGGKERAHAGATRQSPAPGASAGTGPSPDASPSATGESSEPAAPPKGGVPEPEDVDQKDPDAVGKGALTAMWTYDTDVDRGPQDAGVRTADAGWLTETYARRLRDHRSGSAPGAQWETWSQHRAYTTVELAKTEDASKPGDTDTVAWRQWTLTTTPHGRDGWKQQPTTVVAFVHLVRAAAGKPWRVADITVR
ncbi:hypothetical protein [Streptomyces spirodelae]|uniref:Lipoprotein n=1 Tax=Streptomyces spirodelae TaxID=2812904 RepID=A0ABS3X0J4_9ACTN|nr:hypothetical protein [Streptomyces spirodelae]MBO8188892.1 hypothetical protein [Streptomyces spirodelae]